MNSLLQESVRTFIEKMGGKGLQAQKESSKKLKVSLDMFQQMIQKSCIVTELHQKMILEPEMAFDQQGRF